MTIQNQKVQIEEAAPAIDLAPLARLIGLALSGLPTDAAFWAGRGDRQAAKAAEQRRRAKLDRSRARQLRDGEEAPALTPADLKLLKAADAIEAKAVKGKRGAPTIRAQASRLRSVVGDAVIARAEARRADLRLAQSVELDAVREGEPADQVLEAKRGQATKRLRTRDGLKLSHERGR